MIETAVFQKFISKNIPGFNFNESLRDQLSSVDLVNFVVLVEKEYHVEILPTDFNATNLASWTSFLSLLNTKTGNK